MSPIVLALVAIMGAWVAQDALASIAFYPKESWKWNHTARAIRVGIGIALIVIGLAGLL